MTQIVFGRDSTPNPAGKAHYAPPYPLVSWGGFSTPSTPVASRSQRLGHFSRRQLSLSATATVAFIMGESIFEHP